VNGFHPIVSAAVASEHRKDLLRDAARSRMIADLPDRERHQTPRHRTAWWSRITSLVTHRVAPSSA
jgi:hypothetical protein